MDTIVDCIGHVLALATNFIDFFEIIQNMSYNDEYYRNADIHTFQDSTNFLIQHPSQLVTMKLTGPQCRDTHSLTGVPPTYCASSIHSDQCPVSTRVLPVNGQEMPTPCIV
jgi:hypothetical protein